MYFITSSCSFWICNQEHITACDAGHNFLFLLHVLQASSLRHVSADGHKELRDGQVCACRHEEVCSLCCWRFTSLGLGPCHPGWSKTNVQTLASPTGNEGNNIVKHGFVVSYGLCLNGKLSIDDNHVVVDLSATPLTEGAQW